MAKRRVDLDAIIVGVGVGGGRHTQVDGVQRPGASTGDALRIAELEREVRELRYVNEILKAYFAREFGIDLRSLFPPIGLGIADDGKNAEAVAALCRIPQDSIQWSQSRPPAAVPGTTKPMAEFRVLGPVEAVVAGRLVDLGAPKQRALLALLVSRVGQPVAIDVIVEELWAGHPPPSAITSLQAYVANLRRVLEPDRPPRTPTTVLRTCGRSYLLDGRVVEVDVHLFEERARAGWQALDGGDPRQALGEFEASLALWRGQAYSEVADAACVVPEVVRLEELRLSVVEGRCAALLDVGAHEVAVAELEAFTQAHPLRESGCELLSLALYRAGRQADALAALRNNQKRLAEELGIDPRPALQRLQKEILNQAPWLDWHPPSIRRNAPGFSRRRPPLSPVSRAGACRG